jgi:redox-sensitive bicupin YhaK (pirin superfamily)
MLTLRRAEERGHANHGWLDTHHTFSFADYYDPKFLGFGALRVINDDTVAAGAGFQPHSHRDMEIISYVLTGALEHKDSIGNGSVITPGEVQLMSAGTGVTHSEYNASRESPVHFLQIWLQPSQEGLPPGYEQKHFSDADKRARLRLIASPDGAEGSVRIHQDARVFATLLESGHTVTHPLAPGRKVWVHVARGQANVAGTSLNAGDGVAIEHDEQISISSDDAGELLVFDVAD